MKKWSEVASDLFLNAKRLTPPAFCVTPFLCFTSIFFVDVKMSSSCLCSTAVFLNVYIKLCIKGDALDCYQVHSSGSNGKLFFETLSATGHFACRTFSSHEECFYLLMIFLPAMTVMFVVMISPNSSTSTSTCSNAINTFLSTINSFRVFLLTLFFSSHLRDTTLFSTQRSTFSWIVSDCTWVAGVLTAVSNCSVQFRLFHSIPLLYSWIFCLMWESLFFRYSHLSLFSKYVGSLIQKERKQVNSTSWHLSFK